MTEKDGLAIRRLAVEVIKDGRQRKALEAIDPKLLNLAYGAIPTTPETDNYSRRVGSALVAAAPAAVATLDKNAGRVPDGIAAKRQQNTLVKDWEETHQPKLAAIHTRLPDLALTFATKMRAYIVDESESALEMVRKSARKTGLWMAKQLQAQGLLKPSESRDQTTGIAVKTVMAAADRNKQNKPK
jgi:hypothetical protein